MATENRSIDARPTLAETRALVPLRPPGTKRWLMFVLLLIVTGGVGGYFGVQWWLYALHHVYTEHPQETTKHMPNKKLPKQELEFIDVNTRPWRDVPGSKCSGLHERILSGDPNTGDYTRMLRFDPGCDTTPNGVVYHDFWEEVYILEGSLIDLSLQQEFEAGEYACRPPGMPHGPWQAPRGCTTFEVRYTKPE